MSILSTITSRRPIMATKKPAPVKGKPMPVKGGKKGC